MSTSRRVFLSHLMTGSTGVALASTLGSLSFMSKALAANNFDDYKAMVCVMLHGGNDAINTFVPIAQTGKGYSYDNYVMARSEQLTIANNPLITNFIDGELQQNPYFVSGLNTNTTQDSVAYLKGYYPLNGVNDMGLNGLMPELAKRFNDGDMSIIANVGNLIKPTDKAQYVQGSHPKPPFLMAHNHQRRAMHTGWGDNLKASGWAGRIADNFSANGKNISANGFDMNISYSGATRMLMGDNESYLVLGVGDINTHKDLSIDSARHRLQDELLKLDEESDTVSFMRRHTAKLQKRSIRLLNDLDEGWSSLGDDPFNGATGSYGKPLFTPATSEDTQLKSDLSKGFSQQLETVAKMIILNQQTNNIVGLKRQVFYVTLGGFDTHAQQAEKHPNLLRTLSTGLDDFYRALEEHNLKDSVATFTLSDFGRTVHSNGDGTDHAWGSHHIVMGGGVKGGLIGTLPDISLNSDDDFSGKGRIIPTTAQDQVCASLANWFGIEESTMPSIFPNLTYFKTDTDSPLNTAYLSELFNI